VQGKSLRIFAGGASHSSKPASDLTIIALHDDDDDDGREGEAVRGVERERKRHKEGERKGEELKPPGSAGNPTLRDSFRRKRGSKLNGSILLLATSLSRIFSGGRRG